MSPQHITLAVFGEPGSGKKTLVSLLNNRPYTRAQDGKRFMLNAQLGINEEVPASIALVLVDATTPRYVSETTVTPARQAAPVVRLVHTKADLVPIDYSPECISYFGSRVWLASKYDIDCLSASLTTEESVNALIANIVNTVSPCQMSPGRTLSGFIGWLWSATLDWTASRFALPTAKMRSDDIPELASIATDSDLLELVEKTLDPDWADQLKRRLEVHEALSVPIHRFSHRLIMKRASSSERAAMDFVRQNTAIPIPRDLCPHLSFLVMDFVEGEMLHECWSKLSYLKQFRVACTLRLYVKQLRSLSRPTVGAVDDDGTVRGILFDYNQYSLSSTPRFRRFCELVSFVAWEDEALRTARAGKVISALPNPRIDWTPVFVHGDLNLSNLLLDRRGGLWVIDWHTAGFYPSSMESASMRHTDDYGARKNVAASWRRYRQFITGRTSKDEEDFWGNFATGIFRFPSY